MLYPAFFLSSQTRCLQFRLCEKKITGPWKCNYLPWQLIQLTPIDEYSLPFSKWLTSLLPPRLALVPLLVEVIVCLLVLFACFFCLSICQYIFPGSVLVFCKNVHIIAFNIKFHPNLRLRVPNKKYNHWNIHSLSDRECWPDRQTFYGLLVFCPSKALPSLSEWQLLAYIIYAHVANASSCFGSLVPSPHF